MHNEFTDIKLRKPVNIAGVQTDTIRMREPLVDDQLAMEGAGGTSAEQEMRMLCNLCMLAPEDLRKLSLHDYRKLQTAFTAFVA